MNGVITIAAKFSVTAYFVRLLIKPTQTTKQILHLKPEFKKIIVFLFFIGILRGVAEGIWILATQGQLKQVLTTPPVLKVYLTQGLPFIFSNVTTAYVRWVSFALVAFAGGLFLGGKGRFTDFLKLYGIILGIFLVTIIPNYIYLYVNLPVIQFNISEIYNPTIGIGQIITSCWLAYVSYVAVSIVHQLPRFESFIIGLMVPLLNIGILVIGAAVVFNLPMVAEVTQRKVFGLSTLGFIIATIAAVPFFLKIGYLLDNKANNKKIKNTI